MRTAGKRLLASTIGQIVRFHGARIIYFHSVHPSHPLAHRPEVFRAMVKLMVESKWEIVTVGELGERIRSGGDVSNGLSITFDDGYEDNATIATPILSEFGVKATFFVAAGLVGDTARVLDDPTRKHHLYPNLPMMSKDQMRQMSAAGMEIGSHTFSHRYMKNDGLEMVQEELRDSKSMLENILRKPVVSFAFPNGEVPVDARQVLREEGYLQAVNTRWDCVQPDSDPYFLPRQIIDVPDRLIDLRSKLSGKYDYMKYFQVMRRMVDGLR